MGVKLSPTHAEAQEVKKEKIPIVLDVGDALSFVKWKTIDELAKETKTTVAKVKKELKAFIKDGLVIAKGKKYKYENATDYD